MKDLKVYMILAFISYITYPLQSVLNPILYSMVAKEWRKEIVRVFSKISVRSKSNSSFFTSSTGSSMSRKSVKRELNSFCISLA